MRATRFAAVITLSTTIAVQALLVSPWPVSASCNPGRSNVDGEYQAGTVGQPSPYPRGVKADILEYSPYFNSGNSVGSIMSVMLDNGPYWAQMGWQKHQSGSTVKREVFVEHVDGFGSNYWYHWPQKSVGSTPTYKITFTASSKRFNYYIDGSLLAGLNANYTPTRYEIFGETHNKMDQMAGGTGTHATFTNTYYTDSSTFSPWRSLTSDVHYYAPTSRASRVSSIRYDIWDLACSS